MPGVNQPASSGFIGMPRLAAAVCLLTVGLFLAVTPVRAENDGGMCGGDFTRCGDVHGEGPSSPANGAEPGNDDGQGQEE